LALPERNPRLALRFEGRSTCSRLAHRGREAVITLGERRDDGSFTHHPCDLAVFFSVAAARAAGLVLESER
jgi:hypothetical protein